jgi:hypothetical protein
MASGEADGGMVLDLTVLERACSSGASAAGRISHEIAYRDDAVVVTVYVRSPLEADGQSNPPTPYQLVLQEPLSDRLLPDGGVSPAARPSLDRDRVRDQTESSLVRDP